MAKSTLHTKKMAKGKQQLFSYSYSYSLIYWTLYQKETKVLNLVPSLTTVRGQIQSRIVAVLFTP